jgi:MFS transporter, FLVCR family, feline leukemia virus subgroup C receptor-related protein
MQKGEQKNDYSLKRDLHALITNKNYIFLSLTFMMLYGVYTCLGAVINDVVAPFGYTGGETSVLGGSFIFSGIVGSFILSSRLDLTNKYNQTIRLVCFTSTLLTLLIFFTLPSQNIWLLSLNVSSIGFFLLPIIPIGYSYAIELTYPVSESMSNGVLMMFSQIVGSVVTFTASILSDINPIAVVGLFIGL